MSLSRVSTRKLTDLETPTPGKACTFENHSVACCVVSQSADMDQLLGKLGRERQGLGEHTTPMK
jgi:hypothetical protein